MVAYIRSDLDFSLAQIKIAAAHADCVAGVPGARPLFGTDGLIAANTISRGLRTVDGTDTITLQGVGYLTVTGTPSRSSRHA